MGRSPQVEFQIMVLPSFVAIDLNKVAMKRGEELTIVATLTGPYGEPIVGVQAYITLYYEDGTRLQGYQGLTNSNGQLIWVYSTANLAAGNYLADADWTGNGAYEGC